MCLKKKTTLDKMVALQDLMFLGFVLSFKETMLVFSISSLSVLYLSTH